MMTTAEAWRDVSDAAKSPMAVVSSWRVAAANRRRVVSSLATAPKSTRMVFSQLLDERSAERRLPDSHFPGQQHDRVAAA